MKNHKQNIRRPKKKCELLFVGLVCFKTTHADRLIGFFITLHNGSINGLCGPTLQLGHSLAPLVASERHRAISTARHCPANAPVATVTSRSLGKRQACLQKSVFFGRWMGFRVFHPRDIRNDTYSLKGGICIFHVQHHVWYLFVNFSGV